MRLLLTISGCLLSCIPLVAQVAEQRQIARLNEERQIVRLNIVATDNHGHPVNDLSTSDLQISDEGNAQQILYFRRVDRQPAPRPTLGPNERSNRTAATIPHATVILVDLMNAGFSSVGYATHELRRYLETLESADYLYLYFLTADGRVSSVHGLEAEQQVGASPWTRDSKRLLDEAANAGVRARPAYSNDAMRAELTLNALNALGAALSRVPGRKNIVWMTKGVPIDLGPARSGTGQVVDFTAAVRQLSLAFERFQMAIYPVQMTTYGGARNVPDASVGSNAPGTPAENHVDPGRSSRETLDLFAAMTGGRPDSGKDIGPAVAQAMNDARTSYEAGYVPPDNNWNGRFHKLRVTSTKKGVRIQAKSGYYAWPQSPGQQTLEAIRPIAANPPDASEIGIRGTISSVPGGANTSRIDVTIDANDVLTVDEGDRHQTRLTAAIVTYRPDQAGATRVSIPPLIPIDTPISQSATPGVKSPVHFTRDILLEPGVIAVRLIVYDKYAGTIGSVTFPRSGAASPNPR